MRKLPKRLRLARFYQITLLILATALMALPAGASVSAMTFDFGSGLGTLSYTATFTNGRCVDSGLNVFYSRWNFSGFTYTPVQGSSQSIQGLTGFVSDSPGSANGNCPDNGPRGPNLTFNGSGYTIVITPCAGSVDATITAPGYINPKYIVVSVIYAPPGSQSNVTYTNSTLVSSTTAIVDSSSKSVMLSVSITQPGGIFGFLGGSETTTNSKTLTQASQTSTSVTASLTTSQGLIVPGPSSTAGGDYVGVNHDFDIIEVWINPVALFTITNDDAVTWNGYGTSDLDTIPGTNAPVGIDIVGVMVGCLNGDFSSSQTACSTALGRFQRTFAANENWPSGQGPGLTQADLNNILAADPWGHCPFNTSIGSSACPVPNSQQTITPSDSSIPEFVVSDQTTIQYTQPLPGAQPSTNTYMVSTTNSTTQSQQNTTTMSQTYGIESAFTGTGFLMGFGAKVGFSQTLTSSHQQSTSLTQSNTFTGIAHITGPACSGNPCNPPYPPTSATYGTGTSYNIYQDLFFGTFVFIPTAYN